jgi:hypothetical protein
MVNVYDSPFEIQTGTVQKYKSDSLLLLLRIQSHVGHALQFETRCSKPRTNVTFSLCEQLA